MNYWLLLEKSDETRVSKGIDGYRDTTGESYHYDSLVPNHLNVAIGDFVVLRKENEIIGVNRVIKELGFKFPELWDPVFLALLERDATPHPEAPTTSMRHEQPTHGSIQVELPSLRAEFYQLARAADRQAAGLSLEKLLNRLFYLFALNPREPFRVAGEQIDGSFVLDHDIYLLEAKWETQPVNEAALLIFRGKIEGKSAFTRGLFPSINGFTPDALVAITRGKQPTFILADGADLSPVFEQAIRLDDLLRPKKRQLAETGSMLTRFRPR
jgi:hypothetical protein